jgi:hypothetical protein
MPDSKLPVTSTTMIGHPHHSDVRVREARRPHQPSDPDSVYIEIARGPVAVQLSGTLRELQLVAVAVTDGLVAIGQSRGMEGR